MGLIEKLRKAEEQGKQAARNAFERAKELGEDTERRIRQKMRIYPPCTGGNSTPEEGRRKAAGAAVGQSRPVEANVSKDQEPEPIVSVHGEDLKETDRVA